MSLPVGKPNVPIQPQPFTALANLVKPGDFPGQSFWPGQKILPFPAQGQSFQPGQFFNSTVKNVKSGPSENLPITTTLKPGPWANKYDTQQMPGDLIFAGRNETFLNAGRVQMISLGQVNEELRLCFLNCEELSASNKFSSNAKRIHDSIRGKGEMHFFEEKNIGEVLNKRDLSMLYALSAKAICNKWRFLGVRIQQVGRPDDAGLAVTVQVGGPTVFNDPWNIWGNVGAHDRLFLILRRRFDHATSTYREFQFVPSSSKNNYPTKEERYYEDLADLARYGYVICVGSVWQQPISYPVKDVCEAKAGLLSAVVPHMVQCETVSVVLSRGCDAELYL